MHIKAVVPASVIEYPGHIADVLYVGGCNFRCPFCYNVELVLRPQQLPDLDEVAVLKSLRPRAGFVDAVVISGGEPTLQTDLLEFIGKVRLTGLKVKLDTNGYRPQVLSQCLGLGLVDYVAMDVKSSVARYAEATGVPVDAASVLQSISLLLNSSVECEFRTTVVPGLVDLDAVRSIVDLIEGAPRYYLQGFRPGPTVGSEVGSCGAGPPLDQPPAPELMRQMAAIAAPHVREVGLRGLSQG